MMKTISFVIPCYRSERTVAVVIEDIIRKRCFFVNIGDIRHRNIGI